MDKDQLPATLGQPSSSAIAAQRPQIIGDLPLPAIYRCVGRMSLDMERLLAPCAPARPPAAEKFAR
jgi:hypothetical protein